MVSKLQVENSCTPQELHRRFRELCPSRDVIESERVRPSVSLAKFGERSVPAPLGSRNRMTRGDLSSLTRE
jgi:hypothetical protein